LPRADTALAEVLASSNQRFTSKSPRSRSATVSPISDGAAAEVVMDRASSKALNIKPLRALWHIPAGVLLPEINSASAWV